MNFNLLFNFFVDTDGETRVGPAPPAPQPPADQEGSPSPPIENPENVAGDEESRPSPSDSSCAVVPPPGQNQLLDRAAGQQDGHQGPRNDSAVSTPLALAGTPNLIPLSFPVSSALAIDSPIASSSPQPASSGTWVYPTFKQTKRRNEQDDQDADDSSKKRRVATSWTYKAANSKDSSDNNGNANESGSDDDDDDDGETPPPFGTDPASAPGTGGGGSGDDDDGRSGSFRISNHLMTSIPPAHEIDRVIKNYGIYEIDNLVIIHETFGSIQFIGSHNLQLLGKDIDMSDFIEFRSGGIELKEPLLRLSWPIHVRLVNVAREDFANELDKETITDFELHAFLTMVSSAMGASYSRYDPDKKEWEFVRLTGGEQFNYVVGRH